MCNRHQILDFIGERLDEAVEAEEIAQFTANQVWSSVSDHHAPLDDDWQSLTFAKCKACADTVWPCSKLKEVASAWQDHPYFEKEWISDV